MTKPSPSDIAIISEVEKLSFQLDDLIKQATTEKSHYYVASLARRMKTVCNLFIARDAELKEAIGLLKTLHDSCAQYEDTGTWHSVHEAHMFLAKHKEAK